MSRTSRFGIGLGMLLVCVLWCVLGSFWFVGLCVGLDSVGASVFDSAFVTFYFIWGTVFLACLWFAFRNFKRASRPPRLNLPPPIVMPEQQQNRATPDEKLEHLLRKPGT
jgi:hypothetical protein